jgi:hypothetical protein
MPKEFGSVRCSVAQLAVIAAAYFAVGIWSSDKVWYRTRAVVSASAAIAAVGLFWTVQRISREVLTTVTASTARLAR